MQAHNASSGRESGSARRQWILLVDDDPSVREGLSLLLDSPGRTVVTCSDIESAETLFLRLPFTHVVTDVQFSGDLGFEGFHFLTRIATARPDCRIVLMSGKVSGELRGAALAAGATAVLAKPFAIAELEEALGMPAAGEGEFVLHEVPSLEDVLAGRRFSAAFQPIVSLDPQSTLAFEALLRVDSSWLAGDIGTFFEYAARLHSLDRLNVAAAANAIEQAAELPGEPLLFVNLDPSVFADASLPAIIGAASEAGGFPLTRVVLEITERSAFPPLETARPQVEALRAMGIRFALDDHGSAYSHLSAIGLVQPSFIKISQTFGTAFESDVAKTRVIRHIMELAADFGCETILEGVESGETSRAAVSAGLRYAQGFYFGRPSAAAHWANPPAE